MPTAKKLETISYSEHPSVAHARAIIENLPIKTGRELGAWIDLIKRHGPATAAAQKLWLTGEHQIGGLTARLIVDRAAGLGAEDSDADAYLMAAPYHIANMYKGAKAALKPLHDALLSHITVTHNDVKICPCKTMVPLYRNRVIAQIKPATNSRIDFGLALKGATGKLPARLLTTGGLQKGDRITHRIPVTQLRQIDGELWHWFDIAYALDE